MIYKNMLSFSIIFYIILINNKVFGGPLLRENGENGNSSSSFDPKISNEKISAPSVLLGFFMHPHFIPTIMELFNFHKILKLIKDKEKDKENNLRLQAYKEAEDNDYRDARIKKANDLKTQKEIEELFNYFLNSQNSTRKDSKRNKRSLKADNGDDLDEILHNFGNKHKKKPDVIASLENIAVSHREKRASNSLKNTIKNSEDKNDIISSKEGNKPEIFHHSSPSQSHSKLRSRKRFAFSSPKTVSPLKSKISNKDEDYLAQNEKSSQNGAEEQVNKANNKKNRRHKKGSRKISKNPHYFNRENDTESYPEITENDYNKSSHIRKSGENFNEFNRDIDEKSFKTRHKKRKVVKKFGNKNKITNSPPESESNMRAALEKVKKIINGSNENIKNTSNVNKNDNGESVDELTKSLNEKEKNVLKKTTSSSRR